MENMNALMHHISTFMLLFQELIYNLGLVMVQLALVGISVYSLCLAASNFLTLTFRFYLLSLPNLSYHIANSHISTSAYFSNLEKQPLKCHVWVKLQWRNLTKSTSARWSRYHINDTSYEIVFPHNMMRWEWHFISVVLCPQIHNFSLFM